MHYQTRLLPIDSDGGFLLAICHGEHQIGGENTRETGYARFAVGRATEPADLRDLTAACLPARPPSPAAAKYERNMARAQGDLAKSGSYGQSMTEYYSANERAALHSASLAERPAVRVPRFVRTSTTGKALLAFPGYSRHQRGEELANLLQFRDMHTGELIREWSFGRPMALSFDGSRSLHRDVGEQEEVFLVECETDSRWRERARRKGLISYASPVVEGWVGIEGESLLHWFATGLHQQAQAKIPRGALGWTFRSTPDGALVAMSGTVGGDVFVLPRDGGKARRFSPHRGAPREARMGIALSDCGGWVASRCEDDLAITRLHDGASWPLCELKDRVHQDVSIGEYVVRSSVPAAFAFIGGRLLVVEDGVVRAVDFAAEGAKAFVSEHGRAGARKPIRVKRSMPLPELLSAARLKEKADALAPLHSPAVAIKTKALGKSGWLLPTQRKGPALGSSRFGGWPDLPAGAEWPRWQQRPMAFLAQINLAEAHAVEPGLRLPAAGLLSFFLGCSEESYERDGDARPRYLVDLMAGTEPTHAGAWRVLYHPDATGLERQTCPESPLPELFNPCDLRFVRGGLALPDEATAVYPLLTATLSESQRDDYNELVGQLQPGEERIDHQLMGYPRLIQFTPPELMCEQAARGDNPWKFPACDSPEFTELAQAASRWALLLQLTSDGAADFCWGDAGHFYFYGDREAMAHGDFSKTWVNFEN